MLFTSILVVVALAEYVFFTMAVGRARGQFGVAAPAVSGHPEFERYFRVQQNTLEQLVITIPAAFLFAYFVSDAIGALLVGAFVVGRALYYQGYVRDPAARGTGMMVSLGANVLLLAGALIGAIVSAF